MTDPNPSQMTKDPIAALALFADEYRHAKNMDALFGGEKNRADDAIGMFLSHWQLRHQSEANMENLAQYNWQQKAKASVTGLVGAIGAQVPTENQEEVWEHVKMMMANMGFPDGAETIASLIR